MVVKRPRGSTADAGVSAPAVKPSTDSAEIAPLMQHTGVFDGICALVCVVLGGRTVDFIGQKARHEFLPLSKFPECE